MCYSVYLIMQCLALCHLMSASTLRDHFNIALQMTLLIICLRYWPTRVPATAAILYSLNIAVYDIASTCAPNAFYVHIESQNIYPISFFLIFVYVRQLILIYLAYFFGRILTNPKLYIFLPSLRCFIYPINICSQLFMKTVYLRTEKKMWVVLTLFESQTCMKMNPLL